MTRRSATVVVTALVLASCVHVPETAVATRAVEAYLAARPGSCFGFPLDGNSAGLSLRPSRAHDARVWYEGDNPRPITSADQRARLQALTELGLLARDPENDGPDQLAYAVTEKGRPFASARGFCYGRFQLQKILSVGNVPDDGPCVRPPTKVVEFEYRLVGIPDWARSAAFRTAYPDAAQGASRTSRASIYRSGDEWVYDASNEVPICAPKN